MDFKQRRWLLVLGSITILVFSIFFLTKNNKLFSGDVQEGLQAVEVISETEMSRLEYEVSVSDILKMQTFIQEKMYTEIFLDTDAHNGFEEKISLSSLRREPLVKLQNALLYEDIDELIFVAPSSSLQALFDVKPDMDDRIETLQFYLRVLNRENTFKSLSYQFHEDQHKNETNRGVLHLHYKSSDTVIIPFELESLGDDPHHLYYKFITPLADFEKAIKN